MGVDPGGDGGCIPLEKMWGYSICYIPPSSRPTTGSWGGACNDTERCNRAAPLPIPLRQKNAKFVVTTWVLSSSECTKPVFGRGSVPDPAGGAYDAPPDALVGWGGWHPSHSPPPRPHRRLDLAAIPPSSKRNLRQWCAIINSAAVVMLSRIWINALRWQLSTTISHKS